MNTADQPHASPTCGARTRSGAPCKTPPMRGKKRCRMHGGMSPGAPKGNRNAWKHGRYSAEAITQRREFHSLLQQFNEGIHEVREATELREVSAQLPHD